MILHRCKLLSTYSCIGAALLLLGCSGSRKSNVDLAPRSQAVLTFTPPSTQRFELRNQGPATVRMIVARHGQNPAELSLGSPALYMSSLERVQSILLRNEGQSPAELSMRVDDKRTQLHVEHSSLAEQ